MSSQVLNFRIALERKQLPASGAVESLEQSMLAQLKEPVRILRWAVMEVKEDCLICEGAYLSSL